MRLPPGRARAFEAAGKQGYDCVSWSRKRRAGFISRQGVYESPRSSSYAGLRDKMSRTCGHTHEKAEGFFSQNWNGREAILRAFPPWLPISKGGRDCQRRRIYAPFILTVDWIGWLCYFSNSWNYTVNRLTLKRRSLVLPFFHKTFSNFQMNFLNHL